ncbi:MAG: PHP domain-containing protein, partial [Erysipelotrichaceae bacterium]|nr:PHP domain-containing protein [Erysipelotrichaceae bacterium]
YAYNEEKSSYLGSFRVVNVLYHKRNGLVIIKAENGCVLPHSIYLDVLEYFKAMGFDKTKLYIKATDQNLPIREINLYLDEYRKENNGFTGCVPIVSENGFDLSYTDEASYQSDLNELDELKLFFYDLGYRNEINLCYKKPEEPVIIEKEALPQVPRVQKQFNGNSFNGNNFNGGFQNKGEQHSQERPQYFRKTKEYTELKIDDLVDTMYNVKFTGQMFKIDERTTRTGAIIQTVYVKDDSNAVVVKFVESKRFPKEVLKENKEGRYAVFYGYYHLDTFSNDYIFEPDHIEFIEVDDSLHDNEPEKRVELHMHTKLSEMDGVSSPTEVVKAAYSMGHRAVAITDHLCLQGFHEAQMTYKGIMKSAGENKPDFKVLYGCEMNMVSPTLNIVYNATDDSLNDVEYVVFDLETTGLSTRYDYIIEFGAVVMRRGTVVEEKDFFIKPKIDLSLNIKNLTHITEENLKDARPFEECKDEILDFIKGRVLVAHNASFDFGFLNSEFERIGMPKLTNPVIDTLDLSRSLLKNRRAYRLGNMCRAYNIPYDEDVAHRANYDADVLAQVFNFMLKDLAKAGVNTLNDLKNFQDEEAFVKNRAFHTTVLCKNKAGLKDLFKLISISNTKTLAVFGKANTKDTSSEFIAEPRIFKETIEEYRENLLIGSACLNGEVFEIASTRSKEELAKAISFYDYIEVQPLENYRFLYEDRQLFDKERLKQYLRDIIDEALRQNKIVVATGDVHYVRKDEKILRDVYISAQAIGGAHHPLYIFDKEKRAKQITPDQRFLNTREMLDA